LIKLFDKSVNIELVALKDLRSKSFAYLIAQYYPVLPKIKNADPAVIIIDYLLEFLNEISAGLTPYKFFQL
jgi:hypothetical protein